MLFNISNSAVNVSVHETHADRAGKRSASNNPLKDGFAAYDSHAQVGGTTRSGPGMQELRSANLTGQKTPKGRPIVVVLGMHRSGTSLLSHALHLIGVDMADETDRVSHKNPDGFWERPTLNQIQDEILDFIGSPIGSASHAAPFQDDWLKCAGILALKQRLKDYLKYELLRSSAVWGFKDPRTCRLLPLWKEIFSELNLSPYYVIAVRSPGEAAASIANKNTRRAISPLQGELMWLVYNYDILRYVQNEPHTIIEYANWFSYGSSIAENLSNKLDLPKFYSRAELHDCFCSLIDADYRHYRQDINAIIQLPISKTFYDFLLKMASNSEIQASEVSDQISDIATMFKCVFPFLEPVSKLSILEQTNEKLRNQIARLKNQQSR